MTARTDALIDTMIDNAVATLDARDSGSAETLTGTDPNAVFRFPDVIYGDFAKAPEIENIADALIHEHRARFGYLSDAKVVYLWKAKGGMTAGKLKLGACQKPSGLLSFFSGTDFVIHISLDNCRKLRLTNLQMESLVYHELLHTDAEEDEESGEEVLRLRGHDFEGFVDELAHYGPWSADLQAMSESMQLSLFDQDGGSE